MNFSQLDVSSLVVVKVVVGLGHFPPPHDPPDDRDPPP
jgi:hypothetical protein